MWVLSLAMMVLLFAQPASAMEYIRRGMSLCVRTMIPSLFPFMVVSELIVRSGAGESIVRLPARLLGPRLGLPPEGICACLLGLLCGFPLGSRAAAAYYRAGHLTDRQFNVVLAACNVPSSAFLVCAVGLSLFGSRAVGRGMLVLALIAALTSGLVINFVCHKGKGEERACAKRDGEAQENVGSAQILPAAISSAAHAMFKVCATVLLFSALMGAVTGMLERMALSEMVQAVLLGAFEMSSGVYAGALLSNTHTARILCAAIIGWGGLSVHCQIVSVCAGCPLRLPLFWLGRAWQALVCGAGMWLWMRVYPCSLPPVSPPMAWHDLWVGRTAPNGRFALAWMWACCFLFVVGLLVRRIKKDGRG
jgi:sporulation integral membrane protein YlbJ